MSKMEGFRKLADTLARRGSVSNVRVFVGEPKKGDKIYLTYNTKDREFHICWEDNVKLSEPLARKIMPNALAVLLSVYNSEEKKRYGRTDDPTPKGGGENKIR